MTRFLCSIREFQGNLLRDLPGRNRRTALTSHRLSVQAWCLRLDPKVTRSQDRPVQQNRVSVFACWSSEEREAEASGLPLPDRHTARRADSQITEPGTSPAPG